MSLGEWFLVFQRKKVPWSSRVNRWDKLNHQKQWCKNLKSDIYFICLSYSKWRSRKKIWKQDYEAVAEPPNSISYQTFESCCHDSLYGVGLSRHLSVDVNTILDVHWVSISDSSCGHFSLFVCLFSTRASVLIWLRVTLILCSFFHSVSVLERSPYKKELLLLLLKWGGGKLCFSKNNRFQFLEVWVNCGSFEYVT